MLSSTSADPERSGSSTDNPASSSHHPPSVPSALNLQPATICRPPRNGRIAKLPEPIRNHVNEMLDDAVPYDRIILFLAEQGFPDIQYSNISRWKNGGYLDYRLHQERCQELELRRQCAEELAQRCQTDSFDEASKKLLTVLFYEGLNRLDTAAIAQIKDDPKQIVSFFRAFISFRRECLAEQKFIQEQPVREKYSRNTSSSGGRASPRANLSSIGPTNNSTGSQDPDDLQ